MTDNEIIKGLECCANHSASANFRLTYQGQPLKLLLDNALDLINRQKADIEALIAGQETLQKYRDEEINRQRTEINYLRNEYIPMLEKNLRKTDKLGMEYMTESARLHSEVERLQKENDVLIETYSKCQIAIIKGSIERIKQIVCDHCHSDFNKDGKPINVWDAVNGYKAIDNFLKETAGEG